jgi:hypothetical protein
METAVTINVNKIRLCDTVRKESPTQESMLDCFRPVHTFTAYFHNIHLSLIVLPTNCVTYRTICTNYACGWVEFKQIYTRLEQVSHIL